ncbi:MAG TPA: chloride channel protein [Candidatus Coproplasma avicola]|uniref:Chloride channel protein n=1 Tax=Candidatus Coproplasma avicola TaxID=2840744 RepID=A0A9D1E5U4_9FIRM|nr:chloride channel protein [Candidatus Coproplasma avicola]
MIKNKTVLRTWLAFKYYGINIVFLSVLTGIFAGVVVTFYTICTSYGEQYSRELYSLILQYPAFIPLLFVGLAAGAVVIGTLVRFVPMIRGSGIPQIEGACRGKFPFNWYVTMCSMFAASLACVFMGLAAGSEGPSIEIGGCVGEGTGRILRRSFMIRRLQIASGASAGFAVAFNAPVTGMIFALEEAFKSFSPMIFVSASVSVITALGVRTGIRLALGQSVGFAMEGFVFAQNMDVAGYGYVALAALIVALAAVAFYYAVQGAKKMFSKITFLKGAGKFIIPFVLSGAFGLITVYAMGGGHNFIHSLATGGTGRIEGISVFGAGIIASLAIIVALRFILMALYMGCGVPCGVFIPMLAVGAGLGALLSSLFVQAGMDAAYTDYIVIICMSVFFTSFVRAPITGLFMVFELTGQFANLLPALLGVVIASLVAEVCRTEPGYEKNLHGFIRDEGFADREKPVRVTVTVRPRSLADGGRIKSIIWPSGGLVVAIRLPDGTQVIPSGNTKLDAGQQLDFECRADDPDEVLDYLYGIVGRPAKGEDGGR